MGCYHFHLNQLSRGKGQSAIASVAYRAGAKLECTYYGERFNKVGIMNNMTFSEKKVTFSCSLLMYCPSYYSNNICNGGSRTG